HARPSTRTTSLHDALPILVAAQCGIATDDAARLGVANVFWGDDDQVRVGNTDVSGMLALLDSIAVPRGAAWCIVGTGGSARAAVDRKSTRLNSSHVKPRMP